jgi:hypothetical protein
MNRSRLSGGFALLASCALALSGCGSVEQRAAAMPSGDAIRLSPSPGYANARLAVVFGEGAPDPARCQFEWRRNGMRIEGETGRELPPARFRRGDHILVRVVSATADAEPQAWTAQTQVANSAPQVSRVTIAMDDDPAGSALRAVVECTDVDGDTPRLEYEWFRNGDPIENATEPSIRVASLQRGDRLTVSVVARDFESAAPPAQSEAFSLENHAPAFTSQPTAPGPDDDTFAYRAVAADPDGDVLRFEIVSGPDGLTVSPQGQVLWTLPGREARRGDFAVRIRATDSHGGEAVQEFTLRIGQAVAAR